MRVPQDALQYDNRAPGPSFGQVAVTPVSAVTDSPLAAVAAKEVDATLNQYLAGDLILHSTSPYSSPVVVIPTKSGGVRITASCKKLYQISVLVPRVDQVLDSLSKEQVFSLFNLVSSFHPVAVHEDIAPFTVFSTPTALYQWFVMPESISSPSPGWFIKVINKVIKGLEQVAVYLDNVVVLFSDPAAHAETIRSLFERLQYASRITSSFPRRIVWALRMLTLWPTLFRPRVCVRQRKRCQR